MAFCLQKQKFIEKAKGNLEKALQLLKVPPLMKKTHRRVQSGVVRK